MSPAVAGPLAIRIDGRPQRELPATDRGLHFGDGLFETVACAHRTPRFLALHLERLEEGCRRLRIRVPDRECLEAELRELAAEAERSILKLIVTRGAALARGYAYTGAERSTRIALRYAWAAEPPEAQLLGVRVRSARLRLGENPQLAGLKHLNRLEQVLARAEWSDPEIAEALLYSSSGRLVCGTQSNVFLVQQGRLRTPRIDRCGVRGVMRQVVLREALQLGLDPEESELWPADLDSTGELFLTNARIGIWPVREIDGRPLVSGPVTRALLQRLQGLCARPGAA